MNPPYNSITIHQNKELPDLVGPGTKDPFSSSLRILSNNLRQVQLRVMADDTLFWSDSDVPSWSNLEILDVMFHIACPTGRWYSKDQEVKAAMQ